MFVLLSLLGGLAIWAIERGRDPVGGSGGVSFVDAFFTAASAVCVTGLIVVDTSALSLASQGVVLALIFAGGNVLWSTVPVLVRRHFFKRRMHAELSKLGLQRRDCDRLLAREVEYRALTAVLRVAYTQLLWPVLGAIILGAYMSASPASDPNSPTAVLAQNNVNRWWFSVFIAFSSYNNAGFSPLADNLISFATSYVVLLTSSALILFGNIMYPVLNYCSIWLLHRWFGHREPAFAFLLARPRKCFTHMFNRTSTLVLLAVIAASTLSEFALFLALDFNEQFLQSYSGPTRALIGWFQAISTRTAGFNAIDIGVIAPAMQLLYAMLMVSHTCDGLTAACTCIMFHGALHCVACVSPSDRRCV